MDSACVIYHPDNDSPSKLDTIGLPNGSSIEQIVEALDDLVSSNNIPITGVDTDTVDITADGLKGHTIKADVKVSATAGNQITKNADGLFAPAGIAVSPDEGNKIEQRVNGIYVALTAQIIIDLVQNDANFRTLICQIMNECMGECPNIVDVTTG